jgi:hypothetical protein
MHENVVSCRHIVHYARTRFKISAVETAVFGTELPTSALQRFRPESEGQLTFGGRGREDRLDPNTVESRPYN